MKCESYLDWAAGTPSAMTAVQVGESVQVGRSEEAQPEEASPEPL